MRIEFLLRYSRRKPGSQALKLALGELDYALSEKCGGKPATVSLLEGFQAARDGRYARAAGILLDPVMGSGGGEYPGAAISELARGAQVLEDPGLLQSAQKIAAAALSEKIIRGDESALVQGLLDLYETDFDVRWLREAIVRARMTPSTAGGALNLIRLAHFTDREDLRKAAADFLAAKIGGPNGADDDVLNAVDFYLDNAAQIVIVGDRNSPDTREMLRAVYQRFLPNKILIQADGGPGQQYLAKRLPFLKRIRRIKGKTTAYVCVHYKCELPTTDLAKLGDILDGK